MGLRTGAYLKIWKCNKGNGNYYDAQVSTSKKNKQTDQYETDFSGFVRFVGPAATEAANFQGGETVRVGDFEVTSTYNKEKKTTFTNYAIFTFQADSENNSAHQRQESRPKQDNKDAAFVNVPAAIEDDELPFN